MNHNTKKHELLGLMYEDITDETKLLLNKIAPTKISKELKISIVKVYALLRVLEENDEIKTVLVGINKDESNPNTLYQITPKGLIAHSFGYYKTESFNSIKQNVKDIFEIVTPVLSLVVAIVAIVFADNDKLEKDIENIKQQIQKIDKKVIDYNIQNDSLFKFYKIQNTKSVIKTKI